MHFLEEPRVYLVAFTVMTAFDLPEEEIPGWNPVMTLAPADLLTEFAGRACYQSWQNPSGRSNQEYIARLLDQGHTSVLEHASATFYLTGVSRSLTHELVRHRHHSFSQLSQRYVDSSEVNFIVPPEILGNEPLLAIFKATCDVALGAYGDMVSLLAEPLAAVEDRVERRKRARQAARAVLPNATETRVVVTSNLVGWRWFLIKRANSQADREMRRVAVVIGGRLKEVAPGAFQDFTLVEEPDGLPSWQCEHPK